LNDSIKAHQERVSNLAFRKNLLEYQKRRNLLNRIWKNPSTSCRQISPFSNSAKFKR